MRYALATIAVIAAPPAAADVVKADPGGFETATTLTIDAPPATVWDVMRQPALWWSKDHTWSGDAANLSLDARASGCFCETLPGVVPGSVEHARVVFAQSPRTLRLRGALGPLQAEAVTGTLTFTLSPVAANATKVTISYVVGGYIRGGAERLAPVVDRVLAAQLAGLRVAAAAK